MRAERVPKSGPKADRAEQTKSVPKADRARFSPSPLLVRFWCGNSKVRAQ